MNAAAQQPPAEEIAVLRRSLGPFDATMLVAGAMIGSGVFVVSADVARDVGSAGWLLAAWLLTGVLSVLGALSYAELAALLPHAGGQYVFLRESFGPTCAFLYGWTLLLVIQTGSVAAVAVAFAKFLGVFFPALSTENELFELGPLHVNVGTFFGFFPFWAGKRALLTLGPLHVSAGQLVGAGMILALTLLNCGGLHYGKWVQNVFTVAKTVSLALLILCGFFLAAHFEVWSLNWQAAWDGLWQTERCVELAGAWGLPAGLAGAMLFGGALVGPLFAADGWNNVTFTGGEMRDPHRTLPWALVFGTTLVIGLYLCANLAYLAALPVRGAPAQSQTHEAAALRAEAAADRHLAQQLEAEAALAAAGRDDPVLRVRAEQAAASAALDLASAQASARAATRALGIDQAREDRVATALMELAWPGWGVWIMAAAVMISTCGAANGFILMGARVCYAMACDRLLPASLARLNSRHVPAAALAAQAAWCVLLVFSGSYNDLLDYVIFAALLFYVLTVLGLFRLRRKFAAEHRPFRTPGYPWAPALYVLLSALVLVDLLIVKPRYTWPGLLIVASGWPVYWFQRWRSSTPRT